MARTSLATIYWLLVGCKVVKRPKAESPQYNLDEIEEQDY